MYNTSFRCTYLETDSLELYQEELLRACGCQSVDQLVPFIESMYETIQKDEITQLLQKIMILTNVNEELSFYVLFSFDYFSYMHDYLVDPSTFPVLCDKIKV
jgi:hypothetical protein